MNFVFQVLAAILWANLVEWLGHRRLHDSLDAHHVEHHSRPWPTGLLLGHPLLFVIIGAHLGAALYLGYYWAFATWLLYVLVLEGWHYCAHRWPTKALARQHIAHHREGSGNFNVFLPIWDWLLGTRLLG